MSDVADLTPAEITAASEFRARQRELLGQLPAPDITVSVHVRQYRHECAARGGRSHFLELKEHYAFSPVLMICYCGVAGEPSPYFPHDDCAGKTVTVPARRFGFIWTQGRCPACQVTARSVAGRLVDVGLRPPAEHAVIA